MTDLIEKMSDKLHKIWSNWYKYQRDNSIKDNISRWEIQSNTDYSNLSEEDKEKDRKIVREFFSDVIEEDVRQKELIKKLKDDLELLEIKKSILITEYKELHQLLKEAYERIPKIPINLKLLEKIEEELE